MLCHVIDRKRILKVVEGVARIQWTLRRDALISGPKSIVLLSAYLPKVRCCYLPCWTFEKPNRAGRSRPDGEKLAVV